MMRRALAVAERHPGRYLAAIGLLLALAYTAGLVMLPKPDGRIVVGDAVHYYVYLRSALFDGDLQFRNEYIRLYGLRGGEPGTEWVYESTATGHVRNMMSIGPPVVWAPLFAIVAGAVAIARCLGVDYPFDGFGRLFQASAGYSGVAASTLGAWLTYLLCARLYGRRAAIWCTVTMWLASNAVYYSTISPTYSHAASMFAVSWLLWRWEGTLDRQTPWRYAQVGALAGLVALVRWQDAVFLVVPLVDAAYHARTKASSIPGAIGNLLASVLAALLVFSPQVLVWMTLYGRPVAMPQGPEWMRWTAPFVPQVLFSDWHGLLTWTPIVALGLAGLPLVASGASSTTGEAPMRERRVIALACGAAFLASLYANASVTEWWAGEAYGARRFVSCFPIFTLGLAAGAARVGDRPRALLAAAGLAVVLNGLLLLQYEVFMHGLREIAPYPRGLYGLVVARFLVPLELAGWMSRQ